MNIAILAIVLVFMIVIRIQIKRSDKKQRKDELSFWAREEEANFTRRQNIDNLPYISITENVKDITRKYPEDEGSVKILPLINTESRILNLNGIPNTELKMRYGAPNINLLTEYDKNFTDLITGLQTLCSSVSDDEKITLLEFATDIGTDISVSYEELADLYIKNNEPSKIHLLIKKAERIDNIRGPRIIEKMKNKLDNSVF